MKKLFLIISICVRAIVCFSQENNNCEKQWLIDYYFKSDKVIANNLNEVFNNIVSGKYESAKNIIYQLKTNATNNITTAALYCYEATISYNESKYQKSISLSDSALLLLNKNLDNRYRIKALNIKAKALSAINDYTQAQNILDSTIKQALLINDEHGLAASYYLYASVYSDKGQHVKSNEFNLKSIKIRKKINDEIGLAASYSFLGLSYSHLGNYISGIDYIQQSISIREKIGDKRGLANSYLNLYKIYIEIGESDKAMQSEFKSLEICRELNDLQCVSGRLTNIGQIYQNNKHYEKALTYHFMALDISKQVNIKNRIALVHENIARVYSVTNKYDQAIKHLDSSIFLRQSIGDKEGLISSKLVLATINYDQKNMSVCIKNATEALELSTSLNLPYLIKESHQILSNAYNTQNKFDKALFHYKHFIILRDSIYNIDKTKEIVRKELEFDFAKQQELQKLEQQKKQEQVNAESRKQKTIIIISVIALLILSALLLFGIKQYHQKIKSERMLRNLNSDLNLKNYQLIDKTEIIEKQHNTIHQKNNEITDSIRYAHKIQSAMMPLKHEFANYFQESFIIFEPKDIISGDFFWITQRNDKIIYATGDCTGHGVPGGFMSMLGVSLLNEIINEHDLTEPALILSRLRKKVITALKQKGLSGEQQDGMDMTICVLDKQQMVLQYAAANHCFYIVRKKETGYELEEYKGEKQPVGIFGSDLKPFKQYTVNLQQNDTIYTFTDGLADQFGGPKGKKFKYKQLKELLLSIQDLELTEQENIVKEQFTNWKGNLEQVDDVCLIGIRI